VGDAVGGRGRAVGRPRVVFAAASLTGDPARHPNEDAWAADPTRGAFAVCDGVTSTHLADGSYPPWAGGGRAAWLAAAALAAAPPGEPRAALASALATADRLIGALNRARDDGPIDYLEHDVFNTTAVATLIARGRATIACLGDAAALLQPAGGRPRLLTRFQTAAAERLRDELLAGDGMPLAERAALFRRELRNRVEPWCGQAGIGFGVLDGTGRYEPMVEWTELPLRAGDRLYLVSDTTGHCLAALAAEGRELPPSAAEAIALARGWEDERGAAYHDDLTALVVERLA
jgi:serine/threonine protein phosphatase PrpC